MHIFGECVFCGLDVKISCRIRGRRERKQSERIKEIMKKRLSEKKKEAERVTLNLADWRRRRRQRKKLHKTRRGEAEQCGAVCNVNVILKV